MNGKPTLIGKYILTIDETKLRSTVWIVSMVFWTNTNILSNLTEFHTYFILITWIEFAWIKV